MKAQVRRIVLVTLVTALTMADEGTAQIHPDTLARRENCRAAQQLIVTGRPASRQTWAWQYIGVCSPAQRVEAYLRAIERSRTSADRELLGRAIMPVASWHDGRLFNRVLELAGDRSATVPARVMAFVALSAMGDSLRAPAYERFIGGLDELGIPRGGCAMRMGHARPFSVGERPVPRDYKERIRALAGRIARDTAEPEDVRSAAACT
jgi:hypothetical protein